MPDAKPPVEGENNEERLSADEAAALIKAIEDVEREEADAVDDESST